MSTEAIKLAKAVLEAPETREGDNVRRSSAVIIAAALIEAEKYQVKLQTYLDEVVEHANGKLQELADAQKRIAEFEAQSDICKTCDHPRSEHFGDDWSCLEQVWDERRGSDSCRCEAFVEPDDVDGV